MANIAIIGQTCDIFIRMKTQTLNVNLTIELRRYIKDQVRSGRYQNENEVVRDAVRQMQQREIDQFERLFGDYPGSPADEPSGEDEENIKAAIKRLRNSILPRRGFTRPGQAFRH